jgi:hypothetical protein
MDIIFENNKTDTPNSSKDTNSKNTGSDQALQLVANTEFNELVFNKPHEVRSFVYVIHSRNKYFEEEEIVMIPFFRKSQEILKLDFAKELQFNCFF